VKDKKRLHFGVLLSTIDNTCLYEIWRGVAEYAGENDIHLTAYLGTYQTDEDDFASHLGTCFDSIRNSSSLDGVILFSGFLAGHIGIESFEECATEIPENIPTVSVSFSMPGVPSVLADNIGGCFSAVDHLIKVHGKRNIAFVKGPDGHPEAEDRLIGYKNALKENGIAFDERYVLPGHFSIDSGYEAVAELMDVRKLCVDAIAACDDETAIGVLKELENRGISAPTEIAVTGFDDDRFSATFVPSISTAHQNFYDIGTTSADTLYKIINGEPVDDIQYVDSVFIPRQSCGCFVKDVKSTEPYSVDFTAEADSLLSFALCNIVPLFGHIESKRSVQDWITAVVGKIKERPFRRDAFLYLLDEILINYNRYSKDFSVWYKALSILTVGVDLYSDELKSLNTIVSTLFFSTTLVYDFRLKKEKTKELHLYDSRLLLRRISNSLIVKFDTDSMADDLSRYLPELSLHTALVGLYRTPVKSSDPKADRAIETVIGFDGEQKINLKLNNWNPTLFSDYASLDGFEFERERRTFFFIPLFYKDDELGVALLPYDSQVPIEAYETLRVSLSIAIEGALLLSKIQTLSITDDLTGLFNRRGFFQFAHSRLSHLKRDTSRMPYVMFMDMDGLKGINDTYGHSEGDVAITTFARLLQDTLREEDIIGRIGGDEFVVFSSVKSEEDGELLVRRVRDALDHYNKKKLHNFNISACIGHVVLTETSDECLEAALQSADNVLYEEKMKKKKKGLTRS